MVLNPGRAAPGVPTRWTEGPLRREPPDPWLNLDVRLENIREVIAHLRFEATMVVTRDRVSREREALKDYGIEPRVNDRGMIAKDDSEFYCSALWVKGTFKLVPNDDPHEVQLGLKAAGYRR